MDWQSLIAPAVVAAIVSGVITIASAVISSRANRAMHTERLDADAKLAEKKYLYERSLADWKRKTELAEDVLAGFYKARAIFSDARTPITRSGEGASREKSPDESDDQRSYKDALYAPYERLHKEIDFFSELNVHRYRFAALFGSESDSAFQNIVSAFNEIHYATSALLSREHKPDRTLKLEAIIGWTVEDEDPIVPRINEAVSLIEKLCKPVLSSQP